MNRTPKPSDIPEQLQKIKQLKASSEEDRDIIDGYIDRVEQLQTENEKLKKVIRGALAIEQLWLYPLSKGITIQQRDEAKALWIMQKQFEQALKGK